MIQRYTPCIGDSGRGPEPDMKPHETGDMVTYSDYAAAIARAEKAEAERDELRERLEKVIDHIKPEVDMGRLVNLGIPYVGYDQRYGLYLVCKAIAEGQANEPVLL